MKARQDTSVATNFLARSCSESSRSRRRSSTSSEAGGVSATVLDLQRERNMPFNFASAAKENRIEVVRVELRALQGSEDRAR